MPRVLLAQRREARQREIDSCWELPGGKVEFAETAEKAVVREVQEETGYRVDITGILPFSYALQWEYEDFRQHTVIYCYECRTCENSEAQPTKNPKIKQVKWCALDEIDFSRVLPGSREFIWHIAKQYKVQLNGNASEIAYAHFSRLDPSQNVKRSYSIVLQVDPGANQPYVLTTRRGRLDWRGTGRPIVERYSSDKDARDRILYHLKRPRRHGYARVENSDNFPCKAFLDTFAHHRPEGVQLRLW